MQPEIHFRVKMKTFLEYFIILIFYIILQHEILVHCFVFYYLYELQIM